MTEKMHYALEPFDVFETQDEKDHRATVISVMNELVRRWIKDVVLSAGHSNEVAEHAGGTIRTFGSFRIGVNNKSGDIDLLILGPVYVTREHFFDSFAAILKEHKEVEDLTLVPEAYVPAIKLEFMGIEMDLLFAQLTQTSVSEDIELMNIDLLRNLDDKSVRSVNGCRVTDSLLSLVPNKDTFRLALRCIKLWAKRRGVYGNVYGYPGGVAWAIMTARVCQFYPNAAAAMIITKFFMIYKDWDFANYEISLCPVEGHPHGWRLPTNPWNTRDNGNDLMPVLTTSYPAINTCHNVIASTLSRLKDEWCRGYELCPKILAGAAKWEKLWDPIDLFCEFKQFVQITARAPTPQTMSAFAGLVQSTLRVFVSGFPPDFHAVPFPKCYDVPQAADKGEEEPHRKAFFFGIRMLPPADEERPRTTELEISDFFEHFLHQVARKMFGSPSLDPEVCFVEPLLSHKRKTLPLYLFPNGKRPARRKVKKTTRTTSSASSAVSASTDSGTPSSAVLKEPAESAPASSAAASSAPHGHSGGIAAAPASDAGNASTKRKADDELESDSPKKLKEEVTAPKEMEVDDELEVAAAPPPQAPATANIGAPKLRLQESPSA
eukprot:CAMPEP_0182934084 /NCGR_PEP_ID=MMETSP0105_2-20130417/35428_1 /TAXON_ID=81532 ORGANISM="Acanthoeca-like sp., Strain 10tr" /NCGR_SAMPLE_ID=MMETSP0105_2 /ASSEMBLY_ACC=CAM_ASM_000205 /LENGTH=605 /DNA_ID=CAMNT_0025072895 /DNA_START=5 /DNA_END=1822 /DNA_ORIENTATION=-